MHRTEVRRGRRGNGFGIVVTVALHAAVLAAVTIAHGEEQPPLVIERDFVRAELVKLGKPPDPHMLPRITQPPPPKVEPDAPKITYDEKAKAAPKEPPKEDKHLKRDVKNAMDRARRIAEIAGAEEQAETGSLTGSRIGTATQAVGNQYEATISSLLIQSYNLPAGMTPDQIPTPPEIRFRFSDDGIISDVKLTKSSGNPLVDDACVDSAKLTRKVPPPPAGYKPRGMRVACEK